MQYVLKTGFRESVESYSGISLSNNSVKQRSLSTSVFGIKLIDCQHLPLFGSWCQDMFSYISRLFYLSAVMYVDDTDLVHLPDSAHLNPDNLIAYVQQETMDYGYLAQASGIECLVCFMDYVCVSRRARLKTLQELPPPRVYVTDNGRTYMSHICIPST
jgi:hypothetical protein